MKKKFLQLILKAKTNAGFTMIELLIVIAILGILAVAVLSAINPVEQINRGRDTGSRSDAEQLLSAIDRYNAFQGYFPWQDGASDTDYTVDGFGTSLVKWAASSDVIQHGSSNCAVSDLLAAGSTSPATCTGSNELKVTFFSRIFDAAKYNSLSIYHGNNASDSTYICFTPKSDAFKTEAKTRCGASGAGLPSDLSAVSASVCDSTNDAYMICLP